MRVFPRPPKRRPSPSSQYQLILCTSHHLDFLAVWPYSDKSIVVVCNRPHRPVRPNLKVIKERRDWIQVRVQLDCCFAIFRNESVLCDPDTIDIDEVCVAEIKPPVSNLDAVDAKANGLVKALGMWFEFWSVGDDLVCTAVCVESEEEPELAICYENDARRRGERNHAVQELGFGNVDNLADFHCAMREADLPR